MKKITIYIVLIFLLSINHSFAQGNYTSLQYAIGFGSGDLNDYVSQTSFRGILLEYRAYTSPNVKVGIDGGWNVFYEKKDYSTYSFETISLTGVQYRYSSQVPLFLSADYSLNPESETKPYVGLGIGTIYSHRKTDMGVYSYTEEAWQFALKPEVGIIRELSVNSALKVAFKYYGSFNGGGLDAQSYMALSFGFVFM